LYQLVKLDHDEGGRTHKLLSEEVTNGIVASYKIRADACPFFPGIIDGVACAYGSAVLCEEDMGMVEDFFILPNYRRLGIAVP
jgi:hypothetical protein